MIFLNILLSKNNSRSEKKNLSDKLRKTYQGDGGLSKIKWIYRPYICPFHKLLPYIKQSKKHLDIGCGTGLFVSLSNELTDSYGIDIDQDAINEGKSLLGDKIEVYDGVKFPTKSEEYTSYSMIDVFHHIPFERKESFIKGLVESMNDESVLIFKDIDTRNPFYLFMNRLHDRLLASNYGYELSKNKTKEMFEKFGLKTIDEFQEVNFWYDHFALILKKY